MCARPESHPGGSRSCTAEETCLMCSSLERKNNWLFLGGNRNKSLHYHHLLKCVLCVLCMYVCISAYVGGVSLWASVWCVCLYLCLCGAYVSLCMCCINVYACEKCVTLCVLWVLHTLPRVYTVCVCVCHCVYVLCVSLHIWSIYLSVYLMCVLCCMSVSVYVYVCLCTCRNVSYTHTHTCANWALCCGSTNK